MTSTDRDALRSQLMLHEGVRLDGDLRGRDVRVEHADTQDVGCGGVSLDQVRLKAHDYHVARNVTEARNDSVNRCAVRPHLAPIELECESKRRASLRNRHVAPRDRERHIEPPRAHSRTRDQHLAVKFSVAVSGAFLNTLLIRALRDADSSLIAVVARSVLGVCAGLAAAMSLPIKELAERFNRVASATESSARA